MNWACTLQHGQRENPSQKPERRDVQKTKSQKIATERWNLHTLGSRSISHLEHCSIDTVMCNQAHNPSVEKSSKEEHGAGLIRPAHPQHICHLRQILHPRRAPDEESWIVMIIYCCCCALYAALF